jgi:hypothetical protein
MSSTYAVVVVMFVMLLALLAFMALTDRGTSAPDGSAAGINESKG